MRMTAILLVFLGFAAVASADMLTFQQGVDGYTGTRDTELKASEPDAPQGSNPTISIDASDGGKPNHGLLAFNQIFGDGPNQIPYGSMINSASITFTIDSDGSGWNFHRMLMDWSEATETWNSYGNGVQANDIEALSAASYSAGANNGNKNITGPIQVVADLAADLQAWSDGADNYGWGILPFMPDGTNGLDFFSRDEGFVSDRPLLTVDFTPVPEPGSVLLLSLGTALCALLRWKK